MSTEMVLLQARIATSAAMGNEMAVIIGAIVLISAMVLWFEYVMRRWSWLPRQRHGRIFNEKF